MAVLSDTIQAIQRDVHVLDVRHDWLRVEENFLERLQALDILTLQVLERIENVQYVHGYQPELATLYHRAEQLWQDFDGVNTRLFTRLRGQLCHAPSAAPLFHQMCATYVDRVCPPPLRAGFDEDYLDVFVNGVLGIPQTPEETRALQQEMIGYFPTPARVILALLAQVYLTADDVFYDLGAGLGRVALLAGLLTAAEVRGVEFEPAFCASAQACVEPLGLARVRFLNIDARLANYADGTCFFLYTPFTGRLLHAVLTALQAVARTHPITIATYGACTRDVMRQTWLQPAWQQTFAHNDTLALFVSR